jgi:putative DNA primase/helicase
MQEWAKDAASSIYNDAAKESSDEKRAAILREAKNARNGPKIREMQRMAASLSAKRAPTSFKDLDYHEDLLVVEDGTFDLRTGELRESRPEDLMTVKLPFTVPREKMLTPHWDSFLSLLMDDDEEMVEYLTSMLGYMLTGSTDEKCFFIWHGSGNNGKTTLIRIMALILGQYAHNIPIGTLLSSRTDNHSHDVADMRGKRFVWAEEFAEGQVLSDGLLKVLTGGGMLTAARKYEYSIEFHAKLKLVLATNHLPSLRDIGKAMRDRVKTVPFSVDIPAKVGHRRQADVIAEMVPEFPGILQVLVAAASRWYQSGSGLVVPEKAKAYTEAFLDENDKVKLWMQICCEKPEAPYSEKDWEERPFADWYQSFIRSGVAGAKEWTWTRFGTQLASHGFRKRSTTKGQRYSGPTLSQSALEAIRIEVTEEGARVDFTNVEVRNVEA